jgi:hypothetical protein
MNDAWDVVSSSHLYVGVAGSAAEGKDHGNALFSSRDYHAARMYYLQALQLLEKPSIAVGSLVVLAPEAIASTSSSAAAKLFRYGMISDITDSAVEIVFDGDGSEGEDEEEATVTDMARILPLHKSVDQRNLERSLYGNLAKCCVQLKMYGYACRYASIAVEIQRSCKEQTEEMQHKKVLADMLFVRAKVLIAVSKPKLASLVLLTKYSVVVNA